MNRWPGAQLRHIARFRYGDSLAAEDRVDGPVTVFGSNGPIGTHEVANTGAPVIVIGRKGSYGQLNFSTDPVFAIDTTYFVDPATTNNDVRWLFYALSTANLTSLGQDVGVPGLNRELAYQQQLPLPPLAEQRAIADYLDAETARIDALITKKQQLIHLLEERIDSELMRIVGESKLVNPNGTPAVEVRQVLTKLNRTPRAEQMITAFRDGQVTSRLARGKEGFTNSWTENTSVQGVNRGDVVVHGLDGFSGAIGDAETSGVCSPVYHVCATVGDGDSAFFGRLLRLLAVTGYLGNFAVSTRERAVDFRNWDLFGRIPIPLVPLGTQRRIGDRIRKLRPLAEAISRSAALAQERKSALITTVVSGRPNQVVVYSNLWDLR